MSRSAPGKSYRKGMSLVQVIRRFSDEAQAEAWFVETRWPDGVVCPFCHQKDRVADRISRKPLPWHCGRCRQYFSVKTNTVMHRSKLPLSSWAIAFYLVSTNLKGVSSMKLHRDLNVTQKTAWFMAMRIRETLIDYMEKFEGPVEVDETYVGGRESNKHRNKRLNAGRGNVGKTAVAGIKDRKTNRVKAQVVEHVNQGVLQGFIVENTTDDATVFTDEHGAYHNLSKKRRHATVRHPIFEYINGMAHTNGIESFWSMLKRAHTGTFHKMSRKHLNRYVKEFEGRHNRRPPDTEEQMGIMATSALGRRLTFNKLIGPKNERLPGGVSNDQD